MKVLWIISVRYFYSSVIIFPLFDPTYKVFFYTRRWCFTQGRQSCFYVKNGEFWVFCRDHEKNWKKWSSIIFLYHDIFSCNNELYSLILSAFWSFWKLREDKPWYRDTLSFSLQHKITKNVNAKFKDSQYDLWCKIEVILFHQYYSNLNSICSASVITWLLSSMSWLKRKILWF